MSLRIQPALFLGLGIVGGGIGYATTDESTNRMRNACYGALAGCAVGFVLPALFRQYSVRADLLKVRRAYLEAFGIAMGVPEEKAVSNARTLLAQARDYRGISCTLDRYQNPDVTRIEQVGGFFLDDANDGLRFTVGSGVLRLLSDSPKSGFFTHLDGWVGLWRESNAAQDLFKKELARRLA